MTSEIKAINLGGVNCYLVKTNAAYLLIDTGISTKRGDLERELESAGCKPGNLKLIVLTHGDIDHTGNCAYLRAKYGVPVARHLDDSGMVEHGNMGWNRKSVPDKWSLVWLIKSLFINSGKYETFKPDIYVAEGFDLSECGFDAQVLHLPGHSKGSIGVLMSGGDLFCGDLFGNFEKPDFHFLIFDLAMAKAGLEKLKSLKIKTVYPGHGKPFPMDILIRNLQAKEAAYATGNHA